MELLHEKNHCGGRLSFKTQLKIEYLLPYTGSRKVLENIPAVRRLPFVQLTHWQPRLCLYLQAGIVRASLPCHF
jgi:hypothetical protein